MNLSVGIVGLPNVGKSTLFNALLKKQVALMANYPFATIEPNIGVVDVPDERLEKLADIIQEKSSKRPPLVPAVVQCYDIAGLVQGASEGQGLGNKFLAHIREVQVIAHVVRMFEDDNVIHVSNTVDPKKDIETIDAELMLADLSTLQKQQEPRPQVATKEQLHTWNIIQTVKKHLDSGIPIRRQRLSDEDIDAIKQLNLLTIKPVIYVFNVSESQLSDRKCSEERVKKILEEIGDEPYTVLLNAKLETELLELSKEEQTEYLSQFSLTETGLNRFIRQAYDRLQLISFLTAGEKEVRAWTIKKGTLAPQAAGTIHTDFEKKFIKADIVSFEAFTTHHGWTQSRETGNVHTVGKEYVIKDGDVVEFKIGS